MSDSTIWNLGQLVQKPPSEQGFGQAAAMLGSSLIGIACFALAGMAVTAVLVGKDVPQSGNAAYFVTGNLITSGHYSLDLSRPIFVRGNVPICPSDDSLATSSQNDLAGCTTLPASAPAGLIGIVTDGMLQPKFELQMNTPAGPIRGWVNYNNLTN